MIRTAVPDDAAPLAALINAAFVVEAFFKIGDRTSAVEVAALMRDGGEFLLLEDMEQGRRRLVGCVYLKRTGARAYFGMLSVEPARQGRGFGRQLIDAAETRAHQMGCRVMDIHIVNLRRELPGYYRRLGYRESGTLPFSEPDRASRPCSFVVMSKPLPSSPSRT